MDRVPADADERMPAVRRTAAGILFSSCRLLGAGCGVLFLGKALSILVGH